MLQGSWQEARWLELVPQETLGAAQSSEIRQAMRMEKQDRGPSQFERISYEPHCDEPGNSGAAGSGIIPGQATVATTQQRTREKGIPEVIDESSAVRSRWIHATQPHQAGDLRTPDVRRVLSSGFNFENGGLYIGYGSAEFNLQPSWFAEQPRDPEVFKQEREVLVGRPLMVVSAEDASLAFELWDHFKLGQSSRVRLSQVEWQRELRRTLQGMSRSSAVSFGALGALCRVALDEKPGALSLSSGLQWLSRSGVSSAEVLPISLKGVIKLGLERDVEDWVICWLTVLNWMFLGGRRHLFEPMHLSSGLNAAQLRAVGALAEHAKSLLQSPLLSFKLDNDGPGGLQLDSYGPQIVATAFDLTLAQVAPSLPPPNSAAKVAIQDLVGPATHAWLSDPELMLLPEAELPEVVPKAKVMVQGQVHYEEVIRRCFELGLMEGCHLSDAHHHKGHPVLNGLFGVHKKWINQEDGSRLQVLRLITNLIPSNSLLKPHIGASQAMGYAPLWSQIHLEADEVLVMSSEDQTACFHLYVMPVVWRKFFVLSRSVAAEVFNATGQPLYPRLRVVPMGWALAVDLVQEAHEELVRRASQMDDTLHVSRLMQLNRLFPSSSGDLSGVFQSVYVDNWDQFTKVAASAAAAAQCMPSKGQLALRKAYAEAGILRDETKAVESSMHMTSLGAAVDGEIGTVGSPLENRGGLILSGLELLSLKTVSPLLFAFSFGKTGSCASV